MNNFDFSGKVVLVTGATRGIGKAIADNFRNAGARLILTGTNTKQLEILNREMELSGCHSVLYVPVDFNDSKSLDKFLATIATESRIDVCVNNAGINRLNKIDKMTIDDLDAVLHVNLRAPYLIMQTVSRVMKRNNYGRIVNIASIWSVITKAKRSAYTTSKFGLIGMTKTAAVDLGVNNILINAVSPGFVQTDLTDSTLSVMEKKQLSEQIPLQRFAKPDEIAKVVLFLASDINTYITGQNIVVDGGFVSV